MINELFREITFKYVENLVALNWADVIYGLKIGLFSEDDAIMYSTERVANSTHPAEDEINIALLFKGENIHPYIDRIVQSITEEQEDEAKTKVVFILLNWLYENMNKFTDPLEVVEWIYADLDYPKEVEPFVRYMPTKEKSLGTIEKNINRIYKNWKKYLEEKSVEYFENQEKTNRTRE